MAASQCKIPLTCQRLCSPPLTQGHEIRVISAQIEFLGGTAGGKADIACHLSSIGEPPIIDFPDENGGKGRANALQT